jgi:predicted Zn finger-like uncharacterized protein
MAVTKLTCPECKTVLQPAKPLPAGKSVKCPECGTRFTATEEEPAVPLKKPKRAAPDGEDGGGRRPKKPAARKAAPAPAKPAPPKPADDEDEEGGTYRFVDAGEHADDEKPEIEYAPDMSIKDLRGPAQAALVRPSNALILVGALGFFGWLLLLILILIPVLFPIDSDDNSDKSKPPKAVVAVEHGLAAVNDEKDPPQEFTRDPSRRSMFNFFGINVSAIGVLAWYLFILALTPIFLGMVYSAIVTYGGVKIQNLEGRGWGIAASIMVMLPINSWGFMMSTTILLQFLLSILLDDPRVPLIFLMGLETLIGIAVGVWVLTTLMSEKVIKGYEYKPE